MELDNYKEQLTAVKKLIGKNQIQEAFEQSRDLFQAAPSLLSKLDAVANLFHENEKRYLRHQITYEIYTIQRYKVVQQYLDLFRRESLDQVCSENLGEEEKEIFEEPINIDYREEEGLANVEDAATEVSFRLRMMVLDKDYQVITKKYMKVGELASTLGIKIFPHLFDQRYQWNLYYLETDQRESRRGVKIDQYLSIYQSLNSDSAVLHLKGEYSYPQSIGFNYRPRDGFFGISME
ncbi:MAG: hypothetical protein HRU41_40935 [Saprospiraceae bacterium]|nr:hypothetical protein [Saprospiraceae bacterium]